MSGILGVAARRGAQCPAGRSTPYARCCGPLHDGAPAETAEDLMRSRFCAFARGDAAYLLRTWHPRTRPEDLTLDPGHTWTSLEITGTTGGGPDDTHGTVAYRAGSRARDGRRGMLVENARFERRGRRWFYVDGDMR